MKTLEIVTFKGIVLREFPVGENDKFIHIFTKEKGVIEAFVKGGQKMLSKNSGAIQLYAYSDFSLRCDKGKYYLDSSEPIRLFYKLRENLDALALAQYISEIIIYVAGHNEQKKDVMRLLLNTLHYLSEGSRSCRFLKTVFEMRFMTEIGMMPDIVCCASCMKYSSEYMVFDLMSTKLYCSGCTNASDDETIAKIPASVVHALRHIVFADFDRLFNFKLSEKNMHKLSRITEKYVIIHLGREFKTLGFYKSLGNLT